MKPLKINKLQLVAFICMACAIAPSTINEVYAADALNHSPQNLSDGEEMLYQPEKSAQTDTPFDFFLGVDYRKDSLDWNEASANGMVNIMSELKWENLEISQISAAAKFNFFSDWSLRGKLDYGSINSGSNQDSDYNGNNRTLEFSRSNNKGGGEVRDASIGLGRTLRFFNLAGENFLSLSPLAGFSIHQQNLTMTDGVQTIPATGAYPNLNNSYDTQWQGPWVGIESVLNAWENWSLNASAEYHWADYLAHANWNLRSNFTHPVSFVHSAHGRGILLAAGATYRLSQNSRLSLAVEEQQWRTDAGIDRTYYTDNTVGYYVLNSVHWNSSAFKFGILQNF